MNINDVVGYFREENFLPDLKSENRNDVLEELIVPLYERNIIRNRRVIIETLQKRETLGSTGIGFSVAIPHCRTLTVPDIQVVVGISKSGIEYDAIDEEKVTLFFLVISPPHERSNLYLPLLGKIVELLRDEKIRNALNKCDNFSSFLEIMKGE